MSENILMALFDIHRLNFVHRDIRLPNILYHPSSKQFILNDFEYAGLNNEKIEHELVAPKGVINTGESYHKIHDIICLGNLINHNYKKLCSFDTKLDNLLSKFKIVECVSKTSYDKKYSEFQKSIESILNLC